MILEDLFIVISAITNQPANHLAYYTIQIEQAERVFINTNKSEEEVKAIWIYKNEVCGIEIKYSNNRDKIFE